MEKEKEKLLQNVVNNNNKYKMKIKKKKKI